MVTCVTHGRREIFADFVIGRILVRELRATDIAGCSSTLAYVVMPDHLHWLFELGTRDSLSGVVGNLKSNSARKINRVSGRCGQPVWQRGFHDHAMRTDESVIDAARYIIANPLRACLVEQVGDYALWDAVWL